MAFDRVRVILFLFYAITFLQSFADGIPSPFGLPTRHIFFVKSAAVIDPSRQHGFLDES